MQPAVSFTKRTMDVLGSAFGLALALPLLPVVAAAIYLDSPGPIFFRQRRAGRLIGPDSSDPRRFRFAELEVVKFRTMRTDAEAVTGAVLATVDDERVTRVGNVLRRTRLDELPQLWNVLRGDMSLIGPRPERPELMENLALTIPFFEERMRGVRPGITGFAQVSLGYTGRIPPGSELEKYKDSLTNPFKMEGAEDALADDMRMKLLYDVAYGLAIERFSSFLAMELGILLRTPLVMLRGLGR